MERGTKNSSMKVRRSVHLLGRDVSRNSSPRESRNSSRICPARSQKTPDRASHCGHSVLEYPASPATADPARRFSGATCFRSYLPARRYSDAAFLRRSSSGRRTQYDRNGVAVAVQKSKKEETIREEDGEREKRPRIQEMLKNDSTIVLTV